MKEKQEMNPNEIKKALECCMDEMGCKKGCPCFDPKSKSSHCTAVGDNGLEKLALAYINQLEAEVEKYQATFEPMVNLMVEAKSEAIKEFAKFLIDKAENGVISVADMPEYVAENVGDAE